MDNAHPSRPRSRYPTDPARFKKWAQGYGVIRHTEATQKWVGTLLDKLAQQGVGGDRINPLELLIAADRLTNAALWLVVHMTYARRVRLDGKPLLQDEFKPDPQGHTGGSLNMVPAYVGYMLANALSGITRSWIMGQGHTVAAIDSVNLLLDNMRPEHAERYDLSEPGLTRYVNDFYSYKLNDTGNQDSPLGSHVNINTAGGVLEGGYLGFAELQYVHMPLPDERLVAFLSDGAWEEQRGSDWVPHWWRAEDSGLVVPILINNGRRIDQRVMIAQENSLRSFERHQKVHHFDPIVFDGRDPAAFACMIIEGEYLLSERAQKIQAGSDSYPARMPYGIAVTEKGAGFYGAGTNDAHNLPLGGNPHHDAVAARRFNDSAKALYVPANALAAARALLQSHAGSGRVREREHSIANRDVQIKHFPNLTPRPITPLSPANVTHRYSPMEAIDTAFLAYVQANPELRPRVGNPDEMRSNRMDATLDFLKHRVTQVEPGIAESILGAVITALNEEAIVSACLGNKGGINLCATYEAFAPKMLGAVRQEIIWTDHLHARGRAADWLSVPLLLTSHTYENGKNERSHQDPAMCEALLGEPSDISRVLFPADYNTALLSLDACYRTHGRIFTLVVPKSAVANLFDQASAHQLVQDGAMRLPWAPSGSRDIQVILTAIGAFQLAQCLRAAARLDERGLGCAINYIIEPGRFRDPRGRREALWQAPEPLRHALYPDSVPHRVFAAHTRPEVMAGVLRPLDTGRRTIFLGYTNHGGTLDTASMLFVNRLSWAHIVRAAARSLGLPLEQFLQPDELDALQGKRNPQGIIV